MRHDELSYILQYGNRDPEGEINTCGLRFCEERIVGAMTMPCIPTWARVEAPDTVPQMRLVVQTSINVHGRARH